MVNSGSGHPSTHLPIPKVNPRRKVAKKADPRVVRGNKQYPSQRDLMSKGKGMPNPKPNPRNKNGNTPKSYTIKKGDNLTKIAKRYGTTVSALAKKNGIKNVNRIIAGKALKI